MKFTICFLMAFTSYEYEPASRIVFFCRAGYLFPFDIARSTHPPT